MFKIQDEQENVEELGLADNDVRENTYIANVYANMSCQYSGVPCVGLSFNEEI